MKREGNKKMLRRRCLAISRQKAILYFEQKCFLELKEQTKSCGNMQYIGYLYIELKKVFL